MTTLSKLRYNYYRRFCKLYEQQLDTNTYFTKCASQNTMYEDCPIPSKLISKEALMHKVEEDLYAYSSHHGIKIHEGFDELYELIKSKKMELIYTSTHEKKYTDPLFTLTGSLYRPHAFYYNDFSIYEQYQHRASEVLVIASDYETVKLANEYRYNVIYYPAIQDENDEITIRSLAVIHHLIEAINLILDKSRQPKHQYNFIKNNELLEDTFQHLLQTSTASLKPTLQAIYEDEKASQVSHTQEEIAEEFIPEEIKEEIDVIEETESTEEHTKEMIQEEETEDLSSIQLPLIEDSEDLFDKTMVFNFKLDELPTTTENEENVEEENFILEPLEETNEQSSTDIDQIIEELNHRDVNHTQIFTKDELKEFGMSEDDLYNEDDDDEEDKEPFYKKIFSSFLYAVVDSIIVILIYLAMSIGLYDWIFKDNGLLSFLQPVIKTIYQTSMMLFGSIASMIGSFFNASDTLIEGIAVFFMITLVLWIGLIIASVLKDKKKK